MRERSDRGTPGGQRETERDRHEHTPHTQMAVLVLLRAPAL